MQTSTAAPLPEADATPVLGLQNIRKEFGGVVAIEDFSLDVHSGEVVALVGDNGAGKSTLVKIICGVYPPTAGRILIDGERSPLRRPGELAGPRHPGGLSGPRAGGEAAGLHEPLPRPRDGEGPFRRLDRRRMIRETRGAGARLDVRIPSAKSSIRDLSGGQRQGVAIARATHWASKLVLMDEPTAALGVAETMKVENIIKGLRDAISRCSSSATASTRSSASPTASAFFVGAFRSASAARGRRPTTRSSR